MIGSRGDQKAWSCNVLRNSDLHSNPVNTSVSQAGSMATRVDALVGREWLAEEQQGSWRKGEESVATRQSLFSPGQGRWPEDRTSLPRPGIIIVGQNRCAHASALPKPLACPQGALCCCHPRFLFLLNGKAIEARPRPPATRDPPHPARDPVCSRIRTGEYECTHPSLGKVNAPSSV